jgi:hypothetical protein
MLSSSAVIAQPPGSFDQVFRLLGRLIGLADQDAQCAGNGVNLDAAHRQLGIKRALQQASGLAALENSLRGRAFRGWEES